MVISHPDLFNTKYYTSQEGRLAISNEIKANTTCLMPFGKHKGERIADLYCSREGMKYLYWVVYAFTLKGSELPFPKKWAGTIIARAEQLGWIYDANSGRVLKRLY